MTNKQKAALKDVIIILREIRGDYGSVTEKGFVNRIDEKEADLALKILIEADMAPKKLLRIKETVFSSN